jgi:hypothetical protein
MLQPEQQHACLIHKKKQKYRIKKTVKKKKNTSLSVTTSLTRRCMASKMMHKGWRLKEGVTSKHNEW